MTRLSGFVLAIAALALSGTAALADPIPFRLAFVDRIPIHDQDAGLTEPSGLALAPEGNLLWVVSDETPALFALSPAGGIISRHDLAGEDLEGVAFAGDSFVAVDEAGNRIRRYDAGTRETLAEIALADLADDPATANLLRTLDPKQGLEGVTVDRATGEVYVAIESGPRLLLRLSPGLDRITGEWRLSPQAGFRAEGVPDDRLDVSGLDFDASTGQIWIVSDTGRMVFRFDPATGTARGVPLVHGDALNPKRVDDAEGVAYDAQSRRLYIVTDDSKKSRLYVYDVR